MRYDPHLIVTPRGVLAFNGWRATDYMRLSDLQGGEAAALRRDVFSLSGREGGSVGDAYDDPLYPAFTGEIVAQTQTLAVTRRVLGDQLKSYLRATKRADGLWKWLPAGASLTQNGGFEVDASGWAAYGTGTITRDTAQHDVGAASGRINCNGAGNGAKTSQVANQLVPGMTYTASFRAKRTAGSGNMQVKALVYDASATLIGTYGATVFAPTGAFASYSCSFVAPAVADRFELVIEDQAGVAQTLFVDAVKVEYGNTATAYVEPGAAGWSSMRQRACRVYLNALVIPGGIRYDGFNFALACADPIAYSEIQRTSPDITFGGADVTVVNAGDEPSWPTIRITGGITNPTILNVLTGESYVFNGLTVANGDSVDIDTRLGRYKLNSDGSSKVSGLDVANTKRWPLYAGTQTIRATGSAPAGSPKVNLIYRDAWGG